jgi:chromosome segregation ATPase
MTPPEQAMAARLTAIAERLIDEANGYGGDFADLLRDAATELSDLLAHVETLTQQVAELRGAILEPGGWDERCKKAEQETARLTAASSAWREAYEESLQRRDTAEQQRDTALASRDEYQAVYRETADRLDIRTQQRDTARAALKDALRRMSDCARCGARTAAPAQETERGR